MHKPLLGPDGKPIPRSLLVQYEEKFFPFRVLDARKISDATPMDVSLATLVQTGDQFNVMWFAMYMLARDVYSRNPQGSREFEALAKAMGLSITYTNAKAEEHFQLQVAGELKHISAEL